MINTIALTEDLELLIDVPIERLTESDINWYWVDITECDESYKSLLSEHFGFHHLSIEDCLHYYERPKVDYYDTYNFFVLNALNIKSLTASDLNLFVGKNYIVSFHKVEIMQIKAVREKLISNKNIWAEGHLYVTYLIFDKIVDQYFPAVYQIEDKLGSITIRAGGNLNESIINKVFGLREDLLKLRRIINSMKELLYRIINSEHLQEFRDSKQYFNDIYDHLLKLSDIVESNREMTADMRDSYLSINSHRMNRIMTILTIITSIFIPLTFVVGIYGMNFEYMPELSWKYGYFLVLGIMAIIGVGMFLWFKIKGWLNIYK
ncbi:MAG: magnesium/cobalt transporter CorA [Clostridia bacterium]|nr:magnesium/cobalt transporter CorA [Clostridia bacterium]